MIQTKKCIRCGKEARTWCGHVKKRNGKAVLAGWCSKRCLDIGASCHGPFMKKHGEEEARG